MRKYEVDECARLLKECIMILQRHEHEPRWRGSYLAVINAYDVLINSERQLYDEDN